MRLLQLGIRNFRSYGNNLQTVDFRSDGGELILLSGSNGAGKSSLQEAVEFALYGVVRGKNRSRVPRRALSNWTNQGAQVYVDFINPRGQRVRIERRLDPAGMEVRVDGVNRTETYRLMSEEEREDLVGIDHRSYRAYVSLSVNDFLNFLELSPENKRSLVNRIFGAEKLDEYVSVTKGLLREIDREIGETYDQIEVNRVRLRELRSKVESSSSGKVEKAKIRGREATAEYKTIKAELADIDSRLSEIEHGRQEARNTLDGFRSELTSSRVRLSAAEERLAAHRSGTCPLCLSALPTSGGPRLEAEVTQIREVCTRMELEIAASTSVARESSEERGRLRVRRDTLASDLRARTTELRALREEASSTEGAPEGFLEEGKVVTEKNRTLSTRLKDIEKERVDLAVVADILSGEKVRDLVVGDIIGPLNEGTNRFLTTLDSKYRVRIDALFNGEILLRGVTPVDPEAASTGEKKMINLCIALAYLRIILETRRTNVLFLDEVLTSLDPENVVLTIQLLREFATESGVNVVVVHHYAEDGGVARMFDRTFQLENDGFTTITEKKS